MTEFVPQADINAIGLVNEIGNNSPLWQSILARDDKFLQANGETFANFKSSHRGSRSNIDTVGAALFLDANLDSYTINVEMKDDQGRLFATGQKSTVVKQQFLDAITNIEIEYNKIIDELIVYNNKVSSIITNPLADISIQPYDLERFFEETYSIFVPIQIHLHLFFRPFSFSRSILMGGEHGQVLVVIDDISNIYTNEILTTLTINLGVQNNKLKLKEAHLDQNIIDELLDSVNKLCKKDDTLEEFQDAIDEFFDDTDPSAEEIQLTQPAISSIQSAIIDVLTPIFAGQQIITIDPLVLTGFNKDYRNIDSIIDSVMSGFNTIRSKVSTYKNIFNVALQGIGDLFYTGGTVDFSLPNNDALGSCLPQGAIDNFDAIDSKFQAILSGAVYQAVSNQCGYVFNELAKGVNYNRYLDNLNDFIIIKDNAEIRIVAMTTLLLSLSEQLVPDTTALDEQIAILDQLVIDATEINIPLTYQQDNAGIFDLDDFSLFLSFDEETEDVKIIEFDINTVPVIPESFRDAGNCSACDIPLLECDGDLYAHRLADSDVDPTSSQSGVILDDNRFIYYGEKLMRTQTTEDSDFTSIHVVLDTDYLIENDVSINTFLSQDPLRKLGNTTWPLFQIGLPIDAGNNVIHEHTNKVLSSEINPRDPFRRLHYIPIEEVEEGVEAILPQFAKENPYTDFLHPDSSLPVGVTDTGGQSSNDISDVVIIPCSQKPQYFELQLDGTSMPPPDFDFPKGKEPCGNPEDTYRLCGEPTEPNPDPKSTCGSLPAVLFSNPVYTIPRFHNHTLHTELTARAKLWLSGRRTADDENGYTTNEGAGVFFEDHLAVLVFHNKPLSEAQFGTVNGGIFAPLNTTIIATSGDISLLFADGDSISLNVIKNDTYEVTAIGVNGVTIKTVDDYTLTVTENGFNTAVLKLEGGCTHANIEASITVTGFEFENKPLKAGVCGIGGFEAQHFCVTFINERIHGPYVFL